MKPKPKWTKRRPRKAGLYWIRHEIMGYRGIIEMLSNGYTKPVWGAVMNLDVSFAEWSGPIEPPK